MGGKGILGEKNYYLRSNRNKNDALEENHRYIIILLIRD